MTPSPNDMYSLIMTHIAKCYIFANYDATENFIYSLPNLHRNGHYFIKIKNGTRNRLAILSTVIWRQTYHSDSERGNPLSPHGLLLSINSKGSFICTIPQIG